MVFFFYEENNLKNFTGDENYNFIIIKLKYNQNRLMKIIYLFFKISYYLYHFFSNLLKLI